MKDHSWILDVIRDLEAFSQTNQMSRLSEELSRVRSIASSEIAAATDHASEFLGTSRFPDTVMAQRLN